MAYLRKDIFPRGMYSKLNYKKIGPCRILRNISNNAFKLELQEDLDISLILNVANLYKFNEGVENEEESALV
jgi:hypothetical protein